MFFRSSCQVVTSQKKVQCWFTAIEQGVVSLLMAQRRRIKRICYKSSEEITSYFHHYIFPSLLLVLKILNKLRRTRHSCLSIQHNFLSIIGQINASEEFLPPTQSYFSFVVKEKREVGPVNQRSKEEYFHLFHQTLSYLISHQ